MKILITGNLGYVGSYLSKNLRIKNNSNMKIIGFDTGFFQNDITSNRYYQSTVDVQIFDDIRLFKKEYLNEVDCVVHLAAISNDPIGSKFKNATNEVNLLATKNLYNLCVETKVKKFIYASSCSMYGFNENSLLTEDCQLNPQIDYAKSKVESEKFLKENPSNCKVISLRFATAAGFSDRLRLDLLINEITFEALSSKCITLKSNGKAKRPFIDVFDMSNSIISCINRNFIDDFNVFNVGSNNNNFSVLDIANLISNMTGINNINIGESLDNRSYDVDFSKFNNLDLDFRFKSIEETIIKLIQNIDENLDYIKLNERNLKRLNKLDYLINKNLINNNLFWI